MRDVVATFRETDVVAHAGELETSFYLAVDESSVHMDRAVAEKSDRRTTHFWSDLMDQPPKGGRNPVHLTEYWSVTAPRQGVLGDPTCASKEKGRKMFEAGVQELRAVVLEFRARDPGHRSRHQGATPEVVAGDAWPVPPITD